MSRTSILAAAFGLTTALGLAGPALAQQAPKVDPALVQRYVDATWRSASPEWKQRIVQDETQRVCTATLNEPSQAEFDAIRAREAATVVYPADGNVMGDWRRGQQIAQRGTGGQFSDQPNTARGGNCYACHQLSKAEVSFGTLGPSLLEYGKVREFKPEMAREAFAKVYNAMAVFPCSQMPRFGFHKFLTEEQIKDVVAYLFDRESPVNR